jgi:hypothetical protein
VSTTATPDRFTSLPDEHALAATVVALEEHGFSVEVVDDFNVASAAVLARIPEGSSVMTNTSVTLALPPVPHSIRAANWQLGFNESTRPPCATSTTVPTSRRPSTKSWIA